MKTARFKTNIKCMGCVAAITPQMEQAEGVASWQVDIQDPDKILTVQLESAAGRSAVERAVHAAGFHLEELN